MDGRLEFLVVLRAVIACDDDARADGDAVEKADEQKDQTAGGADGGIGVLIQEAADDKGVSCVVELLENVSEQDRQGKNSMPRQIEPEVSECFIFVSFSFLKFYLGTDALCRNHA